MTHMFGHLMALPCTKCGAAPGRACRTAKGDPVHLPHRARFPESTNKPPKVLSAGKPLTDGMWRLLSSLADGEEHEIYGKHVRLTLRLAGRDLATSETRAGVHYSRALPKGLELIGQARGQT